MMNATKKKLSEEAAPLVLVPFWRWPDGHLINPDAALSAVAPNEVAECWREAEAGPIPPI